MYETTRNDKIQWLGQNSEIPKKYLGEKNLRLQGSKITIS